MWNRIKQLEIMIGVAGTIFGLLVAGVFHVVIISVAFEEQSRALLIGFLIASLLSMISIVAAGIIAKRHETHIANTNKELSKINLITELGNTVRSLGITAITPRWTEFRNFEGPVGEQIRKRIQTVKAPATWYLVTISPEAFGSWQPQLLQAVEERGIDIKWVYHDPERLETDEALKAQHEMVNVRMWAHGQRSAEQGITSLKNYITGVQTWTEELYDRLQNLNEEERKQAGSLELYESVVPHFYLAFLSVPRKHRCEDLPAQAPTGTFGFVQLYQMFSDAYETRCAFYLETPGTVLDYYYWSTVQLFDENRRRPYVRRIWPSDERIDQEDSK